MLSETTICAPACPPGGALSIIRLSGPDTFSICTKIVTFSGKQQTFDKLKANTIHYAWINDANGPVDQVMISIFKAPHSYTGEDSIEISCHGSPYIQKKIIELLIKSGATLANPGEFTQRAFLNGKMDLSQAEAVADLIASGSRTAHDIALNQMRGGISKTFKGLREQLINLTSLIELELDFSEEDVEFAKRDELKELVIKILQQAKTLHDSFETGNALKNGVPVAIIGKPNVGKSTLLNHLVQDDKAIVSEIAGTTRDVIEDTIIVNGILFRFIDTAGLRETADIIEKLGIRKTYQKIKMARIILLLVDARDDLSCITGSFEEIRKQISGQIKQLFLLVNMSDLVDRSKLSEISDNIVTVENEFLLPVSAKTEYNLDKLVEMLTSLVIHEEINSDKTVISNVRHLEALAHTIFHLNAVLKGLGEGLSEELTAHDLRQAIHYLGTITGEISNEEVLGNIFKNFCIGK